MAQRGDRLTAVNLQDLVKCLVSLKSRGNAQADLVSLAVGAVYALRRADELGYTDGAGITSWSDVQKAGRAIANGASPLGRFIAGYYYNDALLRLDIAYENALRMVTNLHGLEDQKALVAAGRTRGIPGRLMSEWKPIRDEVNVLKHRNPEQRRRHRAGQGVRTAAVRAGIDNLVSLLESHAISGG